MKLKPIKTNKEYMTWMDWVDIQFDKKIKPDTPEGEKLQVALMLIKDYEDRHYPIHLPDPIEAVKIKMEEKGSKNKDFIGKLGSKSYVSAILNKKKPMTLKIAKIFHQELGIDAETLLS